MMVADLLADVIFLSIVAGLVAAGGWWLAMRKAKRPGDDSRDTERRGPGV